MEPSFLFTNVTADPAKPVDRDACWKRIPARRAEAGSDRRFECSTIQFDVATRQEQANPGRNV
jgi:hypothetical protein